MTKIDVHPPECCCYECEDNNYTRDIPEYNMIVPCYFCGEPTPADPDRYVEGKGWYCPACI